MNAPTGDFRPSAAAQALADALRAGVTLRGDAAAAPPEGDEARLRDLGDLEALPPVAQPGLHAPLVRGARRLLRAFLRPWLAAQTIFNREISTRFGGLTVSMRDAERRLPRLEQGLDELDARLRRIEEAARAPEARGPSGGGEPAGPGALALQRMFVHNRLPRPPARVLNVGAPGRSVAAELASFGFEVWTLDPDAPDRPWPGVHPVRGATGALPFPPGTFDAVFALCAHGAARPGPGHDVPEIARVLRPGGWLLAGTPAAAGDAGAGVATGAAWAPLQVVEAIVMARDGAAWRAAGEGADAPAGDGRADGLLLMALRRADDPAAG